MAGRFDEAREHVRRSSLVLDELNQLTVSSVFQRTRGARRRSSSATAPAPSRSCVARYIASARRRRAARPTRSAIGAAVELANFYCDDGRWDEAADCLSYDRDVPEPTFYAQREAVAASPSRRALPRTAAGSRKRWRSRSVRSSSWSPRENLDLKATVQLALAEVQRLTARRRKPTPPSTTAIQLYEQRGNIAAAGRLRAATPNWPYLARILPVSMLRERCRVGADVIDEDNPLGCQAAVATGFQARRSREAVRRRYPRARDCLAGSIAVTCCGALLGAGAARGAAEQRRDTVTISMLATLAHEARVRRADRELRAGLPEHRRQRHLRGDRRAVVPARDDGARGGQRSRAPHDAPGLRRRRSRSASLAKSGHLAPMVEKPWVKRSLPLVTSLDKYGQGLFAFSPTVSPFGIFTNDDRFKQLGLKIPQTFSQLLGVCRKAKAAGTVAMLLAGANQGRRVCS